MPNCDWGRPCDCIDCRTIYKHIECPECNFKNTIRIIQNSSGLFLDRKGISYYDFEIPKEPIKDLQCYNCNYIIKQVGFYTSIAIEACEKTKGKEQAIKEGNVCFSCDKVEGYDWSVYGDCKLKEKNGQKYCQGCYSNLIKKELPIPSNDREKYEFNERELKWELVKVKIPCIDCGRERWLNVENKWKKRCYNCYKKNITSTSN